MDGKEPKTEEAPASIDENKTKPNKDPGRVAADKKLTEHNKRVREGKKKKGGLKQYEGSRPQRGRTRTRILRPGAEGVAIIIILTHYNFFGSKCRSLTGWTVL